MVLEQRKLSTDKESDIEEEFITWPVVASLQMVALTAGHVDINSYVN